jgi:hypothetical protein
MRRFTVIEGGLSDDAPRARPAMPGRARLEAVGAALRRRLADLPALPPADRPVRIAGDRQPIPAQDVFGIRPVALPPPAALRLVGAVA